MKVFENNELGSVRTMTLDDVPYFVGRDVTEILGYSNSRDTLAKRVDIEDKKDGVSICDSIGRVQKATLINESGLYSLILTSKMPSAKKFKHWVTSEVLPAIRKHGLYATDELIADPDLAIAAFCALKEERANNARLKQTAAIQNQQIIELQPKASYYDLVLNCKDLISTTAIAKDYGKSAVWMNNYLHEKGVQFKQAGVWLLYQRYAEKGYTHTKTHSYAGNNGSMHTKPHTYWTQKGRLFIYSLLKAEGVLPTIEQGELDA